MNKELYTTGFFNDANLASYWRFEGNSNDSKGSVNGTDTSISYGTNYGKFGQGADFNGTTSRITFGTNFNFTTEDFSFLFWINIDAWVSDDPTQGGVFLYKGAWGETGYYAQIGKDDGKIVFVTCQSGTAQGTYSKLLNINQWYHIVITRQGSSVKIYCNGVDDTTSPSSHINPTSSSENFELGSFRGSFHFNGKIDDFAVFTRTLTPSEVYNLYNADKSYYHQGKTSDYGSLPSGDDNSISLDTWPRFKRLLERSAEAGKLSNTDVVSTYSLIHTEEFAYMGGVLAPNGDIHFIPLNASVGQKVSISGVVSTYSLIYAASDAYYGGVLSPNGDIHFIPLNVSVGQKISASGVVSTYSLVYTEELAYMGGVLAPNGDIHFIPFRANRGQKISSSGAISTYSLIYTTSDAYCGGVLSPNGDIHFVPQNAAVGQKISSSGVVSTYSLVHTEGSAYRAGVLAINGDIHFVPYDATVGQKVSISGVVSTYSYDSLIDGDFSSGVLSPNGDIYFIPNRASQILKISKYGQLSTFALPYIGSFVGILNSDGNIYLIPINYSEIGQKISTQSALPFSLGTCCSPFFNKL